MTNHDAFIQSDSSCLSQIDTLLTSDKCLSPSDTFETLANFAWCFWSEIFYQMMRT